MNPNPRPPRPVYCAEGENTTTTVMRLAHGVAVPGKSGCGKRVVALASPGLFRCPIHGVVKIVRHFDWAPFFTQFQRYPMSCELAKQNAQLARGVQGKKAPLRIVEDWIGMQPRWWPRTMRGYVPRSAEIMPDELYKFDG